MSRIPRTARRCGGTGAVLNGQRLIGADITNSAITTSTQLRLFGVGASATRRMYSAFHVRHLFLARTRRPAPLLTQIANTRKHVRRSVSRRNGRDGSRIQTQSTAAASATSISARPFTLHQRISQIGRNWRRNVRFQRRVAAVPFRSRVGSAARILVFAHYQRTSSLARRRRLGPPPLLRIEICIAFQRVARHILHFLIPIQRSFSAEIVIARLSRPASNENTKKVSSQVPTKENQKRRIKFHCVCVCVSAPCRCTHSPRSSLATP